MATPVAVLLVLLNATAVGGVGPPPQGTSPQLQAELDFRREFGLSTDLAFVQAMTADPSAYSDSYPVALTPAEKAEMDRRIAMEDLMDPLEDHAALQPSFAGIWIDQPAGGVITVAFAGDAESHRSALTALTPPGAQLALVNVKYTASQLDEVDEQIRSEIDALLAQGINVGHWYIDVRQNRIVVGLRGASDTATSELGVRYGDFVTTEPSNPATTGCTAREDCFGPPLRAGISGAPAGTALRNRCTIAFLVRKNAAVQWLTAGHCAQTVAPYATAPCPAAYCWTHAGNGALGIGRIFGTCWPQCQYSDAARAGNINNTYASYKVYNTSNNNLGGTSVTMSQGMDQDGIGDYTCLNARKASGWRCGSLQAIGTVCYQGDPCTLWFDEMRFASYASMYGDSGGAVHSAIIVGGVRAYGVHSGCTNLGGDDVCYGQGIYSHIAHILNELGPGLSVCTSQSPCP